MPWNAMVGITRNNFVHVFLGRALVLDLRMFCIQIQGVCVCVFDNQRMEWCIQSSDKPRCANGTKADCIVCLLTIYIIYIYIIYYVYIYIYICIIIINYNYVVIYIYGFWDRNWGNDWVMCGVLIWHGNLTSPSGPSGYQPWSGDFGWH